MYYKVAFSETSARLSILHTAVTISCFQKS